jgi:ectoine hydroxylase-related dioxygenase (phytanoyl-CoA dioxygenase family)
VPQTTGNDAARGRLLDTGPTLEATPRGRMTPVAGAGLKAQWETDGWCVLARFLPYETVAAATEQLESVFPSARDFATDRDPERNAPFRIDSHSVMPRFPFESAAFNDLVLHDRLIDLAEEFLGLTDLRLYQAMLSAKYSSGAESDDQLLHVDYGNHTLVVPRSDLGYQHLELFVYLSDVAADTGATRMVSRRQTGAIPIERTYLSLTDYPHLYEAEVPAEGPAGSVLAYRPDVFHRGVRMTAPASARFMLHVSFKPDRTDWLGSQTWPGAAEGMAWHRFANGASVRQLSALGFPPPGHPYWNERTLAGVAARYPGLDMSPWRRVTPAEIGSPSDA